MTKQFSWPVKGVTCSVLAVLSVLSTQVKAQISSERKANGVEKTYPSVDIKEAPLEYRQFDKVEITGSSIVRKEQTQALPVQVLTREDIRRAGMSSLVEVLHTHPAMSMVVNTSSIGTTIGGYNAASLKGLPAGTLVLLNGKRLSSYGRQSIYGDDRPGVELQTVPLSAIEKIEILSDGASSLYGTDAIAGVINIITRTEQKGVEITAEKFASHQGGGAGHQLAFNAGFGQLKSDGYSIRLTAELSHRDALNASDRPQYAKGRYLVERDGQTYAINGGRISSYTTPGTFFVPQNASSEQSQKVVNALYQNGHCPQGYVPMLGQSSCQYNAYGYTTLYPQQEARRLMVSAERLLSGGSTLYGEALYSEIEDDDFKAQAWRSVGFVIGKSADSVGYQEALQAGLDPSKTQFLWSPNPLDGLKRAISQRNWRLASGLKGEWNDWDYHANVYVSQANVSRRLEVTDFVGQGWVTGKTLTDPNMLRPLTSDNPLTAKLNSLRGIWTPWDQGQTQTTVGNVKASRSIMELDGKDVLLGTGLEWRRESSDYVYLTNTLQQPSFQAQRDIKAGYLELQIPVTRQWDAIASTRRDDYSDMGSTQNSKLASRYDFENGWSARGSWGTGFRAPTVAQLKYLDQLYLYGATTNINECTAQMLQVAASLKTSSGEAAKCVKSAISIYGTGNPDLKPESSQQRSLGLAYRPTRNFSASADWWAIRMTDVISTLSDAAVYADPLKYAQYYTVDANGAVAMKLPNYNIGQREKSGIDFDVRWRQPTDWGQLNLLVQGTYNLVSRDKSTPDQPFVSDLGRYNKITDTITPRMRMRWIAGLTRQNWSLHGVMNYTSGYTEADRTGIDVDTLKSQTLTGFKVPGFRTFDLNATYALTAMTTLRASIGNVFNTYAPQSFTVTTPQVFGVNTRDHNLWGRTFNLAITARF